MKTALCCLLSCAAAVMAQSLPVRGLHLRAPLAEEMPLTEKFIREVLPKEGVNVLVMAFGYRYQYTKHPEVVDKDPLSRDDIKRLVAACREANVKLIPQINMLGHQSWGKETSPLLRAHPEFDETPGAYPDNQGIYCRSYCPLHPQVHAVVFDLIDELSEVCESDAFHVGMDEVFLLGEEQCPRCRGRNKAELFAGEVRTLRDHLAASNRTMWMWGDRFLDAATTGCGKWEAAENGTAPALAAVRKTCHRGLALRSCPPDGPLLRAAGLPRCQLAVAQGRRGFAASGHHPPGAHEFESVCGLAHARRASHHLVRVGAFVRAYYGEKEEDQRALESAMAFKALFAELRKQP
jgi:hypothetical protein